MQTKTRKLIYIAMLISIIVILLSITTKVSAQNIVDHPHTSQLNLNLPKKRTPEQPVKRIYFADYKEWVKQEFNSGRFEPFRKSPSIVIVDKLIDSVEKDFSMHYPMHGDLVIITNSTSTVVEIGLLMRSDTMSICVYNVSESPFQWTTLQGKWVCPKNKDKPAFLMDNTWLQRQLVTYSKELYLKNVPMVTEAEKQAFMDKVNKCVNGQVLDMTNMSQEYKDLLVDVKCRVKDHNTREVSYPNLVNAGGIWMREPKLILMPKLETVKNDMWIHNVNWIELKNLKSIEDNIVTSKLVSIKQLESLINFIVGRPYQKFDPATKEYALEIYITKPRVYYNDIGTDIIGREEYLKAISDLKAKYPKVDLIKLNY